MKKVIIICTIVLFVSQLQVNAFGWNLLNKTQSSTAKTSTNSTQTVIDISQAILNMQNQTAAIDTSVENTFLSIVSQLSPTQESNTIKSKLAAIMSNNTTSEDEKYDLAYQIMSNYAANLNTNRTSLISLISGMSTSEKSTLSQSILSLVQYGQQYASIAKQGVTTANTLMKTTSNIQNMAHTLTTINSIVSPIKNRAATMINLAKQFQTIANYAGI